MELDKVDHNFIPTFGIEMVEGRNFSIDRPVDSTNYILNESGVKQMQLEDPVGKKFNLWGKTGQIIGVMRPERAVMQGVFPEEVAPVGCVKGIISQPAGSLIPFGDCNP